MLKLSAFILIVCLSSHSLMAWGFWAHPRINRQAVFSLPPQMFSFFKVNIDFISRHAVKPDERRYAVEYEAARHYIDLDHYGHLPFTDFPRSWKDAVATYSEDTLQAYGIVPWHIQVDFHRLIRAFKNKDAEAILRISSELGHYVADAHVPLHTTENYNGQMTGQKGIHAFWESRLPELYGDSFDYYVGQAYYIDDPLSEAWKVVLESHTALDSVFSFEKILTEEFPEDAKYGYESRNNLLTRVYSMAFSKAYHEKLNGQVERRMRLAVLRVSSFWYTAWVLAGQPNLDSLANKQIQLQEEKFDKQLKINDRESAYNSKSQEHLMGCCSHPHGPNIFDFYMAIEQMNYQQRLFYFRQSLVAWKKE